MGIYNTILLRTSKYNSRKATTRPEKILASENVFPE